MVSKHDNLITFLEVAQVALQVDIVDMWSKVPVQEEEDSQNGTRAGNTLPIPITSKISLKMFEAHGRPINVIVCACKDRPTELTSCSQKGFEGFITRRCRLKIGGRDFQCIEILLVSHVLHDQIFRGRFFFYM